MSNEIGVLSIVLLYLVVTTYFLRKIKINTYSICLIGIFTAIAVVLRCIRVPLPTGSSIALLSVLPTMILSLFFGAPMGILGGMLTGIIAMFIVPGYSPIHPFQIIVEHIGAISALGYAGVLGNDKKGKIIIASTIAIILNVVFHTFSGVLFFAQNAPDGQGGWAYSLVYNLSSHGVEGLISIVLISLLPIKQLRQAIGGKCHVIYKRSY